MFETFFILMAITVIGVFICEALKSACDKISNSSYRTYEKEEWEKEEAKRKETAKLIEEIKKREKEMEMKERRWDSVKKRYWQIIKEQEMEMD